MDPRTDVRLRSLVERCVPGEPLREGLERILRAGRGARPGDQGGLSRLVESATVEHSI